MKDNTSNDPLKIVIDSANRTFSKRESFDKQILILSATVLGIVVAFQDNQLECLCIRIVFVSSIILFALGILMMSITLYAYVKCAYRTHYKLCEEYKKLKIIILTIK